MPTKTERIIANLPGTFKALPRPSTLYSVIDAFGAELLKGENSLAAVMLAHWVDHADRGAELIDDLARIGVLFGLAPRPDESVEEFRIHLKRYIRTFIEGTVTVQGALRVAAETLGLRIEDQYQQIDSWWTRSNDRLTTLEPLGQDAAELVLGVAQAHSRGQEAQAAEIKGSVDLAGGVDLSMAGRLHLRIDGGAAIEVDLPAGALDSKAASLQEIGSAINAALGFSLSSHDGHFLKLESAASGAGSSLEILDGAEDAAPSILGLLPRSYAGRDATPARLTGTQDLSGGIDLSAERYLRLFIDGAHLAEIDCGGASPANTTIDEVRDAINTAFGFALASHDGTFLTLTSALSGLGSRIEFMAPAAQDARVRLFGRVPALSLGSDSAAARLVGQLDLEGGIDLSSDANLALRIDGGAVLSVNCAGADPARTQLPEIVNTLNAALGATVASHNGRRLILVSPTSGASGSLEVAQAVENDASERLLGLKPRSYFGSSISQAQLVGGPDLAAGVDLGALYLLQLAVDGHEPTTVNLRKLAADRRSVTLTEITAAINAQLGAAVASHDGQHLILTSPGSGGGSQLMVIPREQQRTRRFATRTAVVDEAAAAVFGVVSAEAQGTPATSAQLIGTADLSRGVDLRGGSHLRLALDGGASAEIDCAGARPRATTLGEVVAKINEALPAAIASQHGRHLILTSRIEGEGSRLKVEPSQARDARDILLGLEPMTARGQAAGKVTFTGTVDLMEGIELAPGAALRIGVDGAPPVEIALSGAETEQKSLNQLMLAINIALGQPIAHHDGIYLSLSSPTSGAASVIDFLVPTGVDATKQVFGIQAPRSYLGKDATSARLGGVIDLSGGADLLVRRFLRLGLDVTAPKEIDCAARAADPSAATLDEIVAAINSEVGADAASHDGARLLLTSPSSGPGSRLVLEPYQGWDAAKSLLGIEHGEAFGQAARPAVLSGCVDLLAGVDLSQRRQLRLAVDEGRPVDIDVAGQAPARSFGQEIVAAINEVFPNLAALTDDDRLELTSPTSGADSFVKILPLRYLEVVEYPPQWRQKSLSLVHGQGFDIDNAGASEVYAEAWLSSPKGIVGPALADMDEGWRLTLLLQLAPGEQAHIWRGTGNKLYAATIATDGRRSAVPQEKLLISGDPTAVLKVPQGRSSWAFLHCLGTRFDAAWYDKASFAGGLCLDRGVFNLSRFGPSKDPLTPVFAPREAVDIFTRVNLRWAEHRPGAFTVNLPADLPQRFGGRFNQARFALPGEKPEFYPFTVTEPPGDPDYLPDILNASSSLVVAEVVATVPLGWQAVAMPFRKPRNLTLGSATQAARIYLSEEGIAGFVEIEAKIIGDAGNSVRVAARKSGPALFDVTVEFEGGRFENARQLVLGEPLPALTAQLLQPGPVGLLQAKAAGVEVKVTRERTDRRT